MFKLNSKFMYIVIILLICIILIQVLQICLSKNPSDFIENFEEEANSLSKSDLNILNKKLNFIINKVNCIPDCNLKKKVDILKTQKSEKLIKTNKKKGILFSEDDENVDDENVDEENVDENVDEKDNVEGFIDGLSHNCSHI